MSVIPNTRVHLLLNVPLTLEQTNQRYFESIMDQTNYFLNKQRYTFTDFTYQREDGSIKVPAAYDYLYECNYLMFQNTEYTNKWFYAFITRKEYINPNTTRIHFKIDVFQTWRFEMNFLPSFVIREHADRWNADGTPVINTFDEGLNYGSEYKTVNIHQYVPYNDLFFLVIVCTRTMHGGSAEIQKITPSVNGAPQPLTYYLHPFRLDGSSPRVSFDGTEQPGFSTISEVLTAIYTNSAAVNNVVSLYITEYPGVNLTYDGSIIDFPMANFGSVLVRNETTGKDFFTVHVSKITEYETKSVNYGDKYAGFTQVEESKLLLYPYTVTVISDLKGNQQEIKAEYIEGRDLIIDVKGSLGTSNKVAYNVHDYLMNQSQTNGSEVNLSHSIINNNPNDVPIITDLLAAYLQGNRNSIENQKTQILFNQAQGVIGSAIGGSVQGVIGSAGSGYLNMAGIMAKQKDIQNTPPQIARMGGNTAFDYGNDLKGVYVIKKEIMPEYRKKLSDFFKLFGYTINEVKIPNFKTRSSYNYIQTAAANITGNIPGEDLTELKQIFNNGVTLWHGDFIGDYNRSNAEI
jgi:hypothetical protein